MKKAGKVIMAIAFAIVLLLSGVFIGSRLNPNGPLFAGGANGKASGIDEAGSASGSDATEADSSGSGADDAENGDSTSVNAKKTRHNAGDFYKLAGSKDVYQEYIKKQLEERKKYLKDSELEKNSVALEDSAGVNTAADGAASEDTTSVNSESHDFSTTNTIVEGVDEADIVKTDGKYIFRTYYDGVRITKADGKNLSGCKDIKIADDINKAEKDNMIDVPESISKIIDSCSCSMNEMFLRDDELILFASLSKTSGWDNESATTDDVAYYVPESDGDTVTGIFIYDIKNPEEPKLLSVQSMTGGYSSSRILENGTLLVLTEKYIEDETFYPEINDEELSPDSIYLPVKGLGQILLAKFDISKDEVNINDACAVIDDNYFTQYYITNDSMFLYGNDYINDNSVTNISRFALADTIDALGAATVDGTVQDDFALREKDGNLFVLTSSDTWDDNSSRGNSLFVYDKDMNRIGSLSGIAVGETIYSARYVGNLAYFVTYRNIDPLFAVDISDPENPKLLGELEITGYSDYLHAWGENRLLGIGQETDPKDGDVKGLKITMFDTSDPLELKVVGSTIIKGHYYTNSFDEYKAILASPEKNILGFMYDGYKNGTDYQTGYEVKYEFFSWNEDNKQFDTVASQNIDLEGLQSLYDNWNSYRGLYIGDDLYISVKEGIIPIGGEMFSY